MAPTNTKCNASTDSVTLQHDANRPLVCLFQPSVAFHIETSQLICTTNQMTDFYMKYNTGLKLVKNTWLAIVLDLLQFSLNKWF